MTEFVKSDDNNWEYNKNYYPTKVVVRRLPPNFQLEAFSVQVGPLPEYNYLSHVGGNPQRPHSFSRVYINFVHWIDVLIFKEKFDNYVFVDEHGTEYPAIVEFAPFQGIPKQPSKRRDTRSGTIETDTYYIEFLEMNSAKAKTAEKMEFDLVGLKRDNKLAITPLLKYINEKKSEKKQLREDTKTFPRKPQDNCMVFVNSRVRKNQKFKYRRPKFLGTLYNS